ncbi:MAG: orotate phosphoribosyltransferase [Candidatus Muiribacterium halophilum]|uniref:Orotate phosphoribosyltransferase n=1 Tax=Muiribacterium halophilum TaxID=2053465 RepID=A0A2N5ZHF2_MUIH1|nr:MAG: orotate phosphoribosyltransferase [Candidatus Muirbacterium halophilum]
MKTRVAEILLNLQAVILNSKEPFTYASGIKSPIYCDNRVIISDVKSRDEIIDAFCELIEEKNIKFDVVAGTATAGIPHAAWIADRFKLPMIYVRSGKKEHGRKNQIEGRIHSEQKVLLVEDLISTGGSSLRCAEAISETGAEVVACVAIFSYEMKKAQESFNNAKIPLYTLSDFNTLIEFAKQNKLIEE